MFMGEEGKHFRRTLEKDLRVSGDGREVKEVPIHIDCDVIGGYTTWQDKERLFHFEWT